MGRRRTGPHEPRQGDLTPTGAVSGSWLWVSPSFHPPFMPAVGGHSYARRSNNREDHQHSKELAPTGDHRHRS